MTSTNSDQTLQFRAIHKGMGFHNFEEGPPRPGSSIERVPTRYSADLPVSTSPPVPVPAPFKNISRTEPSGDWIEGTPTFAGMFRRASSWFLDQTILTLTSVSIFSLAMIALNLRLDHILSADFWIWMRAFMFLMNWALITAQEVAFGTSIGKRALGYQLQGPPLKILFRALVFIPGLLLGGLGILMALVHPHRLCFHDWLSGLTPEETATISV